eukprot:2897081-Alexandrium_andersonii.AAC.1
MALCPARRVCHEHCVRSLHVWAACHFRTRSRQARSQEVQYDCLLSRVALSVQGQEMLRTARAPSDGRPPGRPSPGASVDLG